MRLHYYSRFLITPLPVLLGALLLPPVHGDAVDRVIARYVEEMGGRAALERINSVQLRGTLAYEDGTSQSISIIKKRPDKVRLTISTGDIRITQGYNGAVAWLHFEGPSGAVTREMNPDLASAFIRNAPLENALLNRPAEAVTYSLGEEIKLANTECHQVLARYPDQSYSVHYIDKESARQRRILEFDSNGDLLHEIIPSRFARYGGVDFATRIVRIENGKRVSTMDLIDIVINPGSLDAAFDPPQVPDSGQEPSKP